MTLNKKNVRADFDPRFKIFHELMNKKVGDILLISSPYDAWIMEEDCRLSEAIINEYRGLNLSHPPRLHWMSADGTVLSDLSQRHFDLAIVMPRVTDLETIEIADKIKANNPELPIMLLCHQTSVQTGSFPDKRATLPTERTFVWSGNTDLLLAIIKCTEDQMNVEHDTIAAGIRVIIFVEDSPDYISVILPLLYKELVIQTQAVMEEGLNQEHRLLAMRARPKILLAESYEEALHLFRRFEPHVLGVISDVRFPRAGRLDRQAGINLLKTIKNERFDIPLLLISAEPENADKAEEIEASFVDKNSPTLLSDIRLFFLDHLGFGDFVFRSPAGLEISRAGNLKMLEKRLHSVPDDAFINHCGRNDFSRWLFARSEIELASRVRTIRGDLFDSTESHRRFIISLIHDRRMSRQKGIVIQFDPKGFDADSEFFRIGIGSLGGKARGLAFMSTLLRRNFMLEKRYAQINTFIPQTLVIATDIFDTFVENNRLKTLAKQNLTDEAITARFYQAEFDSEIKDQLRTYLSHVSYPVAVRSSSLLEDSQFRAYAGLYTTYMLSNDHPDLQCRLEQLLNAIKMVYASTYFQGPKSFSMRVGSRTEEEKMAVIVQQLVGKKYDRFFYPAISGLAQSHNYYPFSTMKPEDGITMIALGLGRTVMEGGRTLRFSPSHPELLPQYSTVDDILKNSQRIFYALKTNEPVCRLGVNDGATLARREIIDASDESSVKALCSAYIPEEHRIRDSGGMKGYPLVTFASILKYHLFPLSDILKDILAIGQDGMGCPVEIEFAVDLNADKTGKHQFAILQIRPMSAREEMMNVDILPEDLNRAFCISQHALGNTVNEEMFDIVYIKPDSFDPALTVEIARQIGQINAKLLNADRKYLLIGPGRWGSADRWLGIPVKWSDICGVGAIVETGHPTLNAESSQGSHFFHNITSLGINYLTADEKKGNRLDWQWLNSLPRATETDHVAHVALDHNMTLKVDGRKSQAVILKGNML
ncbi:MAG: PEP/pyruvate-binding domain-containing protein [Desulfobacterales bacterium]